MGERVGQQQFVRVESGEEFLVRGNASDHEGGGRARPVLAELEQRVQAESRAGLEVRRAALGNGAGRLGAARLALDRLG